MTDPDGRFCPGQATPGAFGLATARTIRVAGSPLLAGGVDLFSTTLAGTFCIRRRGTRRGQRGGSAGRAYFAAPTNPDAHGSTHPLNDAVPPHESQKIPLHAQSSSVAHSVHAGV